MSAPPPDNRGQNSEQAPPRYVTRLNITPTTNSDNARNDQGKPPVAPKQQPTQQQPQQPSSPKQSSSGNVRHIPIFVEGRDEPVLPKNIDPCNASKPSHFQHSPPPPPHSFGRPAFNTHHQFEPQPPPQTPPQSRKFSQQQEKPQQSQSEQPPPPPPPTPQQAPPKPQPPANDPISRVMTVQKDVDDLAAKVEQFCGTSRKDKEYIYLDEMLTRNLLKLDDIETEGKENVRQARREAIKSIQKCINILEEKVPLPEEEGSAELMESTEESNACSNASEVAVYQGEGAAVDRSSEENLPEQTMEVENNEPVMEQSSQDATERIDKMEVEPANVPCESEDVKMMEVELVKEIETVDELVKGTEGVDESAKEKEVVEVKSMEVEGKQAETAPAGQTTESEQSGVVQMDKAEEMGDAAQNEVTKEHMEMVVPEQPEESQKPTVLEENDVIKPTPEAPLDNVDVTPSKPVQELVNALEVKADGIGAKGSESPKLKGKGTKSKKEAGKTRKGKAGKSAERKSIADSKVVVVVEPVASKTVDDRSEPKVGDSVAIVGRESGEADKDVGQVTDSVPIA